MNTPPESSLRSGSGRDPEKRNELTRSTAADLADALAAREVSSVELTRAHLDRIAAVDPDVHAFLHIDTDGALAEAAASDARRSADGKRYGAIHVVRYDAERKVLEFTWEHFAAETEKPR